MKEFSVSLKEKLLRMDYLILLSVLGMTSLSILTLFGDISGSGGMRRAQMQLAVSVVGLAFVFVISLFDYDELLRRFFLPILGVSVCIMLITVLFGTGYTEESTNQCWLEIPGLPFLIQPSEFVKILFIYSMQA